MASLGLRESTSIFQHIMSRAQEASKVHFELSDGLTKFHLTGFIQIAASYNTTIAVMVEKCEKK